MNSTNELALLQNPRALSRKYIQGSLMLTGLISSSRATLNGSSGSSARSLRICWEWAGWCPCRGSYHWQQLDFRPTNSSVFCQGPSCSKKNIIFLIHYSLLKEKGVQSGEGAIGAIRGATRRRQNPLLFETISLPKLRRSLLGMGVSRLHRPWGWGWGQVLLHGFTGTLL